MEERDLSEKPASSRRREKIRIAREEPIAGIPLIRVVERVGFDVEPVVVPVRVHSPQHVCTLRHQYHHPSSTLRVVSYLGYQSPPASRTDSNLFWNSHICTHTEHARCDSEIRLSEALREERARRTRDILVYEYNKRPSVPMPKWQRFRG